jgi:hypothetical protein
MNSSKDHLKLDKVIVDHVLALQDSYQDGVPFDSIFDGVVGVYDEADKTPPTKMMVTNKVVHLMNYDSMLIRTPSGGYSAIDLDAFSMSVTNIGLKQPFDFVIRAHAGYEVDISECFEKDDGDDEDDE